MRHAVRVWMVATFLASALTSSLVAETGELRAYANPLTGLMKWADHTWVTNYPARPTCPQPAADYWYATGACHPDGNDRDPRPLASTPANLDMARCIAKPNQSTFKPGPATARIVYAIDGVCHQICNRILSAGSYANGMLTTVKKARGYRVSRFAYGTYGTAAQWATLRAECDVPQSIGIEQTTELHAMLLEANMSLSDEKIASVERERIDLRAQIEQIGVRASEGQLAGRDVAYEVNAAVNDSLRRIEKAIGKRDFVRLFDWPAGQEIVLADPDVSAHVEYSASTRTPLE